MSDYRRGQLSSYVYKRDGGETVNEAMPKIKGPELELADIFVPIHTNCGCDSVKTARCAHAGHKNFTIFCKGSSKKWDNVLKIR